MQAILNFNIYAIRSSTQSGVVNEILVEIVFCFVLFVCFCFFLSLLTNFLKKNSVSLVSLLMSCITDIHIISHCNIGSFVEGLMEAIAHTPIPQPLKCLLNNIHTNSKELFYVILISFSFLLEIHHTVCPFSRLDMMSLPVGCVFQASYHKTRV